MYVYKGSLREPGVDCVFSTWSVKIQGVIGLFRYRQNFPVPAKLTYMEPHKEL